MCPHEATSVSSGPSLFKLLAMLLAVPSGRIASGIFRPASTRAAVATVPSPPAATTRSA